MDVNVAMLVQDIIDDERVTSDAISKHNISCGFDENCQYVQPNSSSVISAATSLYEADILLNNKIDELESRIGEGGNENINGIENILIKHKTITN